MPKVSKVLQEANKYAHACCYKIRNQSIEYGKGIDFNASEITKKSKFIQGNTNSVDYNWKTDAKDIFIHNHPLGSRICHEDLLTAVSQGVKKIFASTSSGYTSFDFTTVKKSISNDTMLQWLSHQERIFCIQCYLSDNLSEIINKLRTSLKDFAKFSGATFSEVKWSDYEKVKNKRMLKCQK